jgi:hypothetical protein
MTQAEIAAQAALRQIAKELDTIRRRLLDLHESLPPASLETVMLAGEEDLDVTTEVRTIIECVVQDSIQPAIRDLEAAAEYQTEEEEEEALSRRVPG